MERDKFRVSYEDSGRILVLMAPAKFSLDSSVPELQSMLSEVLEKSGLSVVEIQLAEVTFMDSSALSELLRWRKDLTDRGKQFRLRDPSAKVSRHLMITKLDSIFQFADQANGGTERHDSR